MGIAGDRTTDCILADQVFEGQLGGGRGNWHAGGQWSIESGVGKFDQGMTAARWGLEQWTTGHIIGERYTCEFDVLSIDCDPGPFDGISFCWGPESTGYLFAPGHYAYNWLCGGGSSDHFYITPPTIEVGAGKCTIDNVYLYLQTAAAFAFFAQNWLEKIGTRYEEYSVNGDFVTWYHHKIDASHLAVKYAPP